MNNKENDIQAFTPLQVALSFIFVCFVGWCIFELVLFSVEFIWIIVKEIGKELSYYFRG